MTYTTNLSTLCRGRNSLSVATYRLVSFHMHERHAAEQPALWEAEHWSISGKKVRLRDIRIAMIGRAAASQTASSAAATSKLRAGGVASDRVVPLQRFYLWQSRGSCTYAVTPSYVLGLPCRRGKDGRQRCGLGVGNEVLRRQPCRQTCLPPSIAISSTSPSMSPPLLFPGSNARKP